MRKNTEISNEQYKKLINEFYSYFETGYAFEEFLKVYLEKIGLDEVSVTQRSRDGGIDLKARRNGVGGLSGADEVDYCVQAKRNAPNSTISVSKIRELKGIIQSGQKGLFITTAKFSNDAVKEATNDLSRPVILVDGKALVDSCIEHELGFVFIPVFSKAAMDKLSEKDSENGKNDISYTTELTAEIVVEKRITTNDIRARIMPIPKVILEKLPSDADKYKVIINKELEKELTINRGRNYFAGVTEIFRKYDMIDEDGTFNSKKSTWYWNEGTLNIIINKED